MNEARPYASLSSGLLARKGTAKPAMRPQGFGIGNLEDLGWNDMGQAPGEQPGPPPAPEHVPSSIAALTPAPKIQRINPTDAHLPPEEYGDAYAEEEGFEPEAHDGGHGFEELPEAPAEAEYPAAFEAEPVAEVEPIADFEEPEEFAAPVEADYPAAFEAEPVAEVEPIDEFEEPVEFAAPVEADEPAEIAAEAPAEPVAEEGADEIHAHDPFEAPPVIAQQRAIFERFDGLEETQPSAAPSAPGVSARAEIVPLPKRETGGNPKAAFTLRLDAERHLRLRLACAVTRHSAQQIVARALDEALASIPEIEALASQVPAKPGRAGKRN